MEPAAEPGGIPKEYGVPSRTMAWSDVVARLDAARHYWITTLHADGRPHVVPVDGMWIDGDWYYGGAPQTVHMRNAARDRRISMHIGDGTWGVIVDGSVERARPDAALAERMADAMDAKYDYGRPDPSLFNEAWRLAPTRVLAWTSYPDDVTRFRFA